MCVYFLDYAQFIRESKYAVIGIKISTFSDKLFFFNLRLHHTFFWRFIMANVDLLVDAKDKRLIDRTTKLICQEQSGRRSAASAVKTVSKNSKYEKLLAEFRDFTRSSLSIDSKSNTEYSMSSIQHPDRSYIIR
jgi:hypothetical protein